MEVGCSVEVLDYDGNKVVADIVVKEPKEND